MKKISSYHDLCAEKERLQQRLALLKRDVESEVHEIKEKLKPVAKILGILGLGAAVKGATSNGSGNSLLKMGANLGVDLLVGPRLRKAGMLARMIVPPLLRGISTGIIDRFKNGFSKRK